ncbi:hypothetical protein A2U01_0082799, partial [Trifolium medium]|nr:hypothetical protein [Trifolium medium]
TPREDRHLQGNLRVPNETFCSIQSNRVLRRQELVCTANSVAFMRIRLPLPAIRGLELSVYIA